MFDADVEIVEPAGSDTFVVTRDRRQGSDRAHARRDDGAAPARTHPSPSISTRRVLFDPATTGAALRGSTKAASTTATCRTRTSHERVTKTIDVVIIGSGMGGATFAAGLAPVRRAHSHSGAGRTACRRSPDARDARAIFQRGVFRPKETWFDAAGDAFNPGNYYYVGGNTKLYGAVLAPLSRAGFRAHRNIARARRPAGRSPMRSWSPGTPAPRRFIRCAARWARTRQSRAIPQPYPFRPVPDEPAIARGARAHEARRPASVFVAARRRHRRDG